MAFARSSSVRLLPALALALAVAAGLAAGCRSGGASPQQGGFGPLPVQVQRLAEREVLDFDEYLASLTSRRSITLYPQVAGYVRAIKVHPGDRVRAGALLATIDPGQQSAMLRSLAANLQTKRASLAYAVQNDEASRDLVKAGLIGQLDYQQRRSQRAAAEADVTAAGAQVQAQRDLLRFYDITGPSDGVVGDVPVKIDDYVSQQTRLTSVDQDRLVEAYIYVPTAKAGRITPETAIQLVDDRGSAVCDQKPAFISPQVNGHKELEQLRPRPGALRRARRVRPEVHQQLRRRLPT
ncbi:MAG: efflux RND transporter periplasmic adaptor subunit [Myxococcales bacterium]|nr:efflux RND transporter periplasmic adaptor subunit [Myxococcales bacterium]